MSATEDIFNNEHVKALIDEKMVQEEFVVNVGWAPVGLKISIAPSIDKKQHYKSYWPIK